jgi:DNA-binding CsgD family transcriptional regulator/PAS domain-containing protein
MPLRLCDLALLETQVHRASCAFSQVWLEAHLMALNLSLENLSDLISDIYDCAIHPEVWEQTLAKINSSLDGAYTAISMADKAYLQPRLIAHSPWSRDELERLHRDFAATDVVGARESAFGDVDAAVSTMSLIAEAEFQESRFFREWAGPQGLRDGCILKFADTADRFGQLVTTTRLDRDIISADERRFMALLSPHLRRAALIGDLLDNKRVETQLFRGALDRLSVAVFLVDSDSRVMYANEKAEVLLASQSHVVSKVGVLTTVNAAMAEPMADAIRRTTSQDLGSRGIGIPVSAGLDVPAVAYVLPLGTGAARSAFQPAAAAVFISTSVGAAPAPEAVLATLYDLTPSEARVLLKIGEGQSVSAVALLLAVSENTVKTHLARIFQKVGVNRQPDLVAIVAALRPPVTLGDRGTASLV